LQKQIEEQFKEEFHLPIIYPIRNNAPLEFLTGFTSPN